MVSSPNIKYLFEPRSIAIIGASYDNEKIGHTILENIVAGDYAGKVYPINPKAGVLYSLKVFKSLDEIKEDIDLAVIVIPAKFVFDEIKKCAKRKVKFALIISSGFSEVGNSDAEKKIVEFAKSHGMRILGPNIFGLFSAKSNLNATFGPKNIKKGNIAIITQSGALGIAMIGKTAFENVGLSSIVSVGNKADIDEADLLEYFMHDPETKSILIYVEGVKNGEKFSKILKEVTKKKPVVVVKAGRSKKGVQAVASHTGALSGSDDVFNGVMKQCRTLRADTLKEALDWSEFFVYSPHPKAPNTLILTNGGGIGVLATDAAEKYGVTLYDNLEDLKKTFAKDMPYFGSLKNPIDLTGQADPLHYNAALSSALKNKNIHAVIALYCETAVFDTDSFAKIILENYVKFHEARKPIVFCLFGGEKTEKCLACLRKKVPVFSEPYDAVSCIGAQYTYYKYLLEKSDKIDTAKINSKFIDKLIKNAKKEKRQFLFSKEGQQIINSVKIPLPKCFVARNVGQAVEFANKIGYPVAMKIVSKDILHKSDAGGVFLNVKKKQDVIEVYHLIIKNVKKFKRKAKIDGIEICEMVPKGAELIIGARRDPIFGPVVMCGLGGIYVELMKDFSFRSAFLNRKEALSMLQELRSYPLLLGVRGEKGKDIESVIDSIIKIATIIRKHEDITDLEINPLTAYPRGVKAVDVRILISGQK
ncbi:MAG: CoA-binding protein [Candidatus Diapherotrites archaeon CG08_land_8_20_14_0_20_34_12]|nr:MAG: CoA-binding protein [Candidatus Diapherotrites archaeon CG08_land_8_20_14_0_20_34_12]